MATAAQYTANRANAQQSTGPKTPSGIENCKHNATRHGLTGKQIVIKGEDPAQFDALRLALVQEHQPETEFEAMLVHQIAVNWWRLERARAIESQVIDMYGLFECTVDPDAVKAFQNITRYCNTIERSWRLACTELARRQKARRQAEAEAEAESATADEPEIGSVSQPTAKPIAAIRMESPRAQNAPRPLTSIPRE